MEKQELTEALSLFDSAVKWQAFTALADQRDALKELMYATAAKKATAFFANTSLLDNPEWLVKQANPNKLELDFYLKDYGPNSVRLSFGWYGQFCLRTSNRHDFNKAAILLTTPEFKVLELAFGRIDIRQDPQYPEFQLSEKFNFSFGSPSDEHFGPIRLAWYAHNMPESLLTQIAAKVAKFQTAEATEALVRLNEEVKPKS